jgi:hypothetical protein
MNEPFDASVHQARRAPSAGATPAALPRQPERRLAAAVLLQAIEDLARLGPPATDRTCSASYRRIRPLLAWFASDDVAWPYSFVNVCAHLRLDPGAVRARLRNARRQAGRQSVGESLQILTEVA